ncbi:MAG TPA: pyruvate kinase [Planctomycetota bacterium]|nr:pyruvate kinase [Planctomycetota bacterium]
MAQRFQFDRFGTRILATLGPASSTPEQIEALARAGASAFRLNFSHGPLDAKRALVRHVREISKNLERPLALVGDLSGPKLRTRENKGGRPVPFPDGAEVVITTAADLTEPGRIAVDYEHLAGDVRPGDRILFDDGSLEARVTSVEGADVRAVMVFGGELGARKGLNLPGVRLSIPAITAKDQVDLQFCIDEGIDLVALSFVRDAADAFDLKRRIGQCGANIPVIAKIEKPEAVENLEAILDVADGVMVARGDLGVELSPERVPVVQKQVIAAARRKSRLVITATQMLDSMQRNPRPTRAEASDVANAIFDGTDVVMLSGETATGRFPVESVRTMAEIALIAEQSEEYRRSTERFHLPAGQGVAHAAVRAACVAAEELGARAIVPFTASGWTAFLVAGMRPRTPVTACTFNASAYHRLALCWGVTPVLMPRARDIDDLYVIGMQKMLSQGRLDAGDMVVVLTGSVVRGSGANTIKIHRVGTADLSDDPETRRRLRALVESAESGDDSTRFGDDS